MTQAAPTRREEPEEDLPPIDLTPRTVTRRSRGRAIPVIAVLLVLLGALVFVAVKSLGDASLFFYNADEAVARKADLGERRFRLQGTVEEGSLRQTTDSVEFVVFFGGAEVPVVHQGDPPELFQPNIPVVLEGHWEGDTFASDRIMVKHTSSYEEDNPDRLDPVDTPAADDLSTDGLSPDGTESNSAATTP